MGKMNLNICYVDDNLDLNISNFLFEYCEKYNEENQSYLISSEEYKFDVQSDTYKSLLLNKMISTSNILLIDSSLFTHGEAAEHRHKGEHFRVVLKNRLPYIKTIVISQDVPTTDKVEKHLIIPKFQEDSGDEEIYYEEYLTPILDTCLEEIIQEFSIIEDISLDREILDAVLLSDMNAKINGIQNPNIFEKEDLDKLIELFSEVKDKYDSE